MAYLPQFDDGTNTLNLLDYESATFNNSIGSWTTYADAAGSAPVDGVGGSPTVTFVRSVSAPLKIPASVIFTKDASNRQGQGASVAFSIQVLNRARVLTVTFDHIVQSGTYATGDLTIYLIDTTNGTVIQPTGYQIQNTSSSLAYRTTATFQTTATGANYLLALHVATTSSSPYALKMDNFAVMSASSSSTVYGVPASDWTSYTPTGTFTTNTTYTGKWRRVGDTMEVKANLAFAGAPNSASLSIALPSGYTIDTTKLVGSNPMVLGNGQIVDTGVAGYPNLARYGGTTTQVDIYYTDDAAGGVTRTQISQAAPFTIGSTDTLDVTFVVPISGWTSNVIMSDSADTRVIAASASGNPASAPTSSDAIMIFPSTRFDTHGAYSTSSGQYTVPVAGYYQIMAHAEIAGTEASNQVIVLSAFKNGSAEDFDATRLEGTALSSTYASMSTIIQANAGDLLDVRIRTTITSPTYSAANTGQSFSLQRIGGPATIAATETVAATYNSNSGQAIGSTSTTLIYEDLVKDTHGSYNTSTGVYTIPVAGWYNIEASYETVNTATWVNGNAVRITILVNASTAKEVTTRTIAGTTDYMIQIVYSQYLSAGDTVKIQGRNAQSAAMNTSNASNVFSIYRIGI